MPAKKRPAAVDSAAASNAAELGAASPTPPTSKKPAGKRAAKAPAKPAPESAAPKQAKAKSKRTAPSAMADAVVPEASEIRAAVVVTSAPTAQHNAVVLRPRPSDDEIRQHAYFLSLRRNGRGDPIADWMEAERALRAGTD